LRHSKTQDKAKKNQKWKVALVSTVLINLIRIRKIRVSTLKAKNCHKPLKYRTNQSKKSKPN